MSRGVDSDTSVRDWHDRGVGINAWLVGNMLAPPLVYVGLSSEQVQVWRPVRTRIRYVFSDKQNSIGPGATKSHCASPQEFTARVGPVQPVRLSPFAMYLEDRYPTAARLEWHEHSTWYLGRARLPDKYAASTEWQGRCSLGAQQAMP